MEEHEGNKRTECWQWAKNGSCSYKKNCKFKHGNGSKIVSERVLHDGEKIEEGNSSWFYSIESDVHITNDKKDFIKGTEKIISMKEVKLASGEVFTAVLEGEVYLPGSKVKLNKRCFWNKVQKS